MTTTTKLADIKARAEKATPGPWVAFEGNEADGVTSATWGQLTWDDHGGEVFKPEDAEFIANARTDVPKLVAALEAVEALADSWSVTPKRPTTFDAALHHAHIQIRTAITNAMR